MRVTVITPVGPSHERYVEDCKASVLDAMDYAAPASLVHDCIDDTSGELGRSRARNIAAARAKSDWLLLLDADDLLHREAFDELHAAVSADPSIVAVFGAVNTDRFGIVPENKYPLRWADLLRHGPEGTLSMGCFIRSDVFVPFNETMDAGEDFDFYLRVLHNRRWVKIRQPLAIIRRDVPSATGPRGYESLDWWGACWKVVNEFKAKMTRDAYSPLKVFHHHQRLQVLRDGGQPAPAQVQLVISDFCNESCSFCAYRMEGYSSNELFKVLREDGTVNNNPKRMMPLEKCLEILDDCKAMGVGAIQITGGGEPTVHPDHAKVFAGVLERGLGLALVTNGIILRDEALASLARAAWVRVSIDAGRADTYAAMRRVPVAYFKRAWDSVTKLRDARHTDLVVGVGFVVTKENWREVVTATQMAKDAGADNIRLSAVFQPEDEKYFADFHAQAVELCRQATALSDGCFTVFNNFGERVDDLKQHSPDYSFCGYQNFSTYIGGDQNVYRCCVTSFSPRGLIGSLKDKRFIELWNSQAKRDDFASFDARGCERCMFNGKNRTINYAMAKQPQHVNFV